jgi:hypothetical protein
MLEAVITKSVVLQDKETGGPVLMGVAEYGSDAVNFKVKYDWETLDQEGFLLDLRDKLAMGFDLPVYRVDLREKELLDKMCRFAAAIKVNK